MVADAGLARSVTYALPATSKRYLSSETSAASVVLNACSSDVRCCCSAAALDEDAGVVAIAFCVASICFDSCASCAASPASAAVHALSIVSPAVRVHASATALARATARSAVRALAVIRVRGV